MFIYRYDSHTFLTRFLKLRLKLLNSSTNSHSHNKGLLEYFYDFFLLFRHKKNSKANLINIFSYNNNISTYLSQTFHFISNSINSVTHSLNILLPRHHFKVIDQIDMSIHLVLSTDVCLSMCDVFMCYFRSLLYNVYTQLGSNHTMFKMGTWFQKSCLCKL